MNTTSRRRVPLIMIADADEEERGLMRAILKLVGFDVIEAADSHHTVKLATEQLPDLLVIDLALSLSRGCDVIERIRMESALPELPVVAVSTEEMNPPPKVTSAFTAFLPKPIEYELFYRLIDRFLQGRLTALARSKCLPL
jgi:two-component system, cell cycle response regulator DivK